MQQTDQADQNQINRNNEIQQPRHDQDEDAGDQGDEWRKGDGHGVHKTMMVAKVTTGERPRSSFQTVIDGDAVAGRQSRMVGLSAKS